MNNVDELKKQYNALYDEFSPLYRRLDEVAQKMMVLRDKIEESDPDAVLEVIFSGRFEE